MASLRSPPFRSPQLLNPILNVQLGIHKFTSLSSSNKIVMLVVTSQLGILIAPYKINGYRTRALLASSADVCRLAILAFMDRRKITPILLQGNMLYYMIYLGS